MEVHLIMKTENRCTFIVLELTAHEYHTHHKRTLTKHTLTKRLFCNVRSLSPRGGGQLGVGTAWWDITRGVSPLKRM